LTDVLIDLWRVIRKRVPSSLGGITMTRQPILQKLWSQLKERNMEWFLEEFKEFLDFCRGLWGLLIGISILFPLSNELTKAIPLGRAWWDGGFVNFSPNMITLVATLTAQFVLLWTFGQRHECKDLKKRYRIQKVAIIHFAVGLATLIIYLIIHYLVAHRFFFFCCGWSDTDSRYLLTDVCLLVSYAVVFACMTAAFGYLAIAEWIRKKSGIKRGPEQ
jgi:hypothetical protein